VVAARKAQQAKELVELEEAFGTGRGTGTIRKRLETRHRRELRRLRFDAIRDAVADLLAAYRDLALIAVAAPPEGLIHADRAATFERLAAGMDPAAAIRAAGVLEEADRRLAIGVAPLLTLEATFLSVQAALAGPRVPMTRMEIR
jgi:DNA polymerase III subunit delta'